MSRREPKQTVDEQRCVSINEWIRDGLLAGPGSSWTTTWLDWAKRPAVVLDFTYAGHEIRAVNSIGRTQTVKIIYARVGPDSWRRHFACPIPGCGRCCDHLYVANFRDYEHGLGCRLCLDLVYGERSARRLTNLRQRLGAPPDMLSPVKRPKGMHWKTYDRLRDRVHTETMRWAGSVPIFSKVVDQTYEDIKALGSAHEAMLVTLKSLPNQSAENAATIWATFEAFNKKFDRFMSEWQRDQIYAALPPPAPEPRRVEGGVGTARRYRPPRPASRRRKSALAVARKRGLIP